MSIQYGYVRVSTSDQSIERQMDTLLALGIDRRHIYIDHGVSGAKASRPEWDKLLSVLEKGDTLNVASFSRAGRSSKHLIDLWASLDEMGVTFHSVKEASMCGDDASGKLMRTIMAAFCQFERDLISERTINGLEAARKRGRNGGRPPSFTKGQELEAKRLYSEDKLTVDEICEEVGIKRGTFYNLRKEWVKAA